MDPAARLIPADVDQIDLDFGGRRLALSNLRKPYWPDDGYTKGDLLRYYAALAPVILPHIRGRAMTMKRYPHGIGGEFFFMKRAPREMPGWIPTCEVPTDDPEPLVMPEIDDLPGLLWVVNLGCIDLNPSYGRCDAIALPDYLHFDLDPTEGAVFGQICEAAQILKQGLDGLGMPAFAKTTGGRGIHVYVPIVRGPTQEDVWAFAKAFAHRTAHRNPALMTAEYVIRKRPRRRVHVDYNQNSRGKTLASVYSVRPLPGAPASAPVTWEEVGRGIRVLDFKLATMADRLRAVGDLWAPVDATDGRFDLRPLLDRRKEAIG